MPEAVDRPAPVSTSARGWRSRNSASRAAWSWTVKPSAMVGFPLSASSLEIVTSRPVDARAPERSSVSAGNDNAADNQREGQRMVGMRQFAQEARGQQRREQRRQVDEEGANAGPGAADAGAPQRIGQYGRAGGDEQQGCGQLA